MNIKIYRANDNNCFYHSIEKSKINGKNPTPNEMIAQLKQNIKESSDNWGNSLYLALSKETAMGYMDPLIENSVIKENQHYLLTLTLCKDLEYIDNEDARYADGSVANGYIPDLNDILNTAEIKALESKGLMHTLGEKGYAFQCYCNEEEKELIVPIQLIGNFKIEKIQLYSVNRDGEITES